jgi:hypothetical protein
MRLKGFEVFAEGVYLAKIRPSCMSSGFARYRYKSNTQPSDNSPRVVDRS